MAYLSEHHYLEASINLPKVRLKFWSKRVRFLRLIGVLVLIAGASTSAFALDVEWPSLPANEINLSSDSKPGWVPTSEQQEEALSVVETYLDAIDNLRYAEAYEMHAEDMKSMHTLAEYTEFMERLGSVAQSSGEWRVSTITWSKDPGRSPIPGVYVAVDHTARFANIDRYCGYIILYQETDDSDFVIVRHEMSFIDNDTAQGIVAKHSKEKLDELWIQASRYCPNYNPATAIE